MRSAIRTVGIVRRLRDHLLVFLAALGALAVGSGGAQLLHLLVEHGAPCLSADDRHCHSHHHHQHGESESSTPTPHAPHDDESCAVCITLGSLVTSLESLTVDARPIATLVCVVDGVDELVAPPAPLAAIAARPPPRVA